MNENELKLLSIKEASQYMSIGVSRVNDLINEKKIGFIALGKKRMIPFVEIQRFIKDSLQFVEFENSNGMEEFVNASTSYTEQLNSLELFNKMKEI